MKSNTFGVKNKQEFSNEFNKLFKNPEIKMDFKGKEDDYKLSDLGGSIDISSAEQTSFSYPFLERIVPFTIFKSYNLESYGINFNANKLDEFIHKYADNHKILPNDAKLKIVDSNKVVIEDSKSGSIVDLAKMKDEIIAFGKSDKNKDRFKVPTKEIKAEKLNKYFEQSKKKIESIVSKDLTFIYNNGSIYKKYILRRSDIAKLIAIKDENSNIKIDVNREEYKKFIQSINNEQEIKPGVTNVNIVDDVEVGRENGKTGLRVSFEKNLDNLVKYFSGEIYDIEHNLILENIMPIEKKKYSYSFSQTGLQAKVNEIGRRYNVRISIQQLNGNGWGAGYRANEPTPAASTYKLFVALRLFKEINDGGTTWNGDIKGTPIKSCFHQMIIVSTNACAEAWLSKYGRQEMNDFVRSIGINTTSFTNKSATTTSANDIRRAIAGIYDGSLASGENRNIMLDHLSRQQWRSGIPRGSKGRVFDKVGFLWNYVHDTAVVEHPKGTYSVAIMTENANYNVIAQITRELEAFMYP